MYQHFTAHQTAHTHYITHTHTREDVHIILQMYNTLYSMMPQLYEQ